MTQTPDPSNHDSRSRPVTAPAGPPEALVKEHAKAFDFVQWLEKWGQHVIGGIGILLALATIAAGVFVVYLANSLSRHDKKLDDIATHSADIAGIKASVEAMKTSGDRQYTVTEDLRKTVNDISVKTALIDKLQEDVKEARSAATEASANAKSASEAATGLDKEVKAMQAQLAPLKTIKDGVDQTQRIVSGIKTVGQARQSATIRVPLTAGKAMPDVGKFAVFEVALLLDDVPLLAKPEMRRGLEITSAELQSKSNADVASRLAVIPSLDEKYEKIVLSIWVPKDVGAVKFEGDFQVLLNVSWPFP